MNTAKLIGGEDTAAALWQGLRVPLIEGPAVGARLVVIAPHPDDEVLACGGLLALHAAAGGACLVLAVTDGEASDRQASPSRLAAVRRIERVRGLQRLGLAASCVHRLGLPDGQVGHRTAALVDAITPVLHPSDWVVATWRHDGHPDHDATGLAAAQACAATGSRLVEAPVWMWHWASPADERVPWQRLRALPLTTWVLRRKQQALVAHASQWAPRLGGQAPVLDAAMRARALRPHEYFFV